MTSDYASSIHSWSTTESETTVETIEYEYDEKGMVKKETRTTTHTRPKAVKDWPAAPPAAPFPPYRHPVWYYNPNLVGSREVTTRLWNSSRTPSTGPK